MKTGIEPAKKPEVNQSVKKIDFQPLGVKDYHERRHHEQPHKSMMGPTNDNLPIGLRAFEKANRPSSKEYNTEKEMSQKKRIKSLYDQRNGLPMTSLGDKNYKNPDYQPDFFKKGGLIVGSS